MTPGRILIRADASVEIGTGHVMRCLALAQAWQDAGGEAAFAMAKSSAAIGERLAAEKIEVFEIGSPAGSALDAARTAELGRACGAEWIVLDGYRLDAHYQCAIKRSGLNLLWIDDNGHATHYVADVIVNQNLHAGEQLYRNREPCSRLLLGPRYAMLRREFSAGGGWKREVREPGTRVLITMGGSDPGNATVAVVNALRLTPIENLDVVVAIGGSNPHVDAITRASDGFPGELHLLRNPANMPELMAWADIAISAAGATCWEMCMLGLPAVLIDVAENQRPIAQRLARLGIAIHAGSADAVSAAGLAAEISRLLGSAECRAAMSRRGRDLVDGDGARRVVNELQRAA